MQNVAFHHPEIQNRVFCLYRVSTLGQVDKLRDDIPMQRQACHAYIAQQGWHFVDELSEKGVSGFKVSAKDRDAIQILQQKAMRHEFDILLVLKTAFVVKFEDHQRLKQLLLQKFYP